MRDADSSPIRVGLIGYGYSGRTFHAPLIRSVPGLELRLVGSGDPSKVHADLPGMAVIADPMAVATSDAIDLIVVATPNETHAPLARAALGAGKHVVVDKPFTLGLAEARSLTSLASGQGRLLSVFHNRRWDSDYLSVRKAIADGLVGEVRHFESHFDRYRPEVRDRWREGAGPGSGIWYDLGPHLVDQALQLFGLPDRVTASFARLRAGAKADDWAHVVMEYPALRVVLHASMLVAGGSPRFLVHGDAGSVLKLEPDVQESQLVSGMTPGSPGWGRDPDALVIHGGGGTVGRTPAVDGDQRRFYRDIVEAIDGLRIDTADAMAAVAVMACIEAALASARTGTSLVPALTPDERDAFGVGAGSAAPDGTVRSG